jgi:hypothetical protein
VDNPRFRLQRLFLLQPSFRDEGQPLSFLRIYQPDSVFQDGSPLSSVLKIDLDVGCLGDSLKEFFIKLQFIVKPIVLAPKGKLLIFERDLRNFIDSTKKMSFAILHLK